MQKQTWQVKLRLTAAALHFSRNVDPSAVVSIEKSLAYRKQITLCDSEGRELGRYVIENGSFKVCLPTP